MLRKFGSGSKPFRLNRSSDEESKERYRTRTLKAEAASGESCEEHEASGESAAEHKANNTQAEKKNGAAALLNGSAKESLTSGDSEVEQTTQIGLVNGISKKLGSSQSDPTSQAQSGESELVSHSSIEVDESQSESDNDSSEKGERQQKAKAGPRIVKPGSSLSRDLSVESNGTDKSEPEVTAAAPKGIRGRRKPLYSAAPPSSARKSTTPQPSPVKQTTALVGRSNTSPIVRPTRATTLRQNNSIHKSNSTPKMSAGTSQAKRAWVPAPKKLGTPIKPLERQGTFTKDEPEMENVPMVVPMSPCLSKPNCTKPASTSEYNIVSFCGGFPE